MDSVGGKLEQRISRRAASTESQRERRPKSAKSLHDAPFGLLKLRAFLNKAFLETSAEIINEFNDRI